jgi:hypothetical protein
MNRILRKWEDEKNVKENFNNGILMRRTTVQSVPVDATVDKAVYTFHTVADTYPVQPVPVRNANTSAVSKLL